MNAFRMHGICSHGFKREITLLRTEQKNSEQMSQCSDKKKAKHLLVPFYKNAVKCFLLKDFWQNDMVKVLFNNQNSSYFYVDFTSYILTDLTPKFQ